MRFSYECNILPMVNKINLLLDFQNEEAKLLNLLFSAKVCHWLSFPCQPDWADHFKGTGNLLKTNTWSPWQLAAPRWYLGKAACGQSLLADSINILTKLMQGEMVCKFHTFLFFYFYNWLHTSSLVHMLGILTIKRFIFYFLNYVTIQAALWSPKILFKSYPKIVRVTHMWFLTVIQDVNHFIYQVWKKSNID